MTTDTIPDLGSIQTASPYILIVDDAAGHIELMRDAFASSPLETEICTAARIDEARARISERMPDLVICDLLLPDGNGVDLLPAGERETAPYPIVILTAHGGEHIAVEAMKAGALDYVVKSNEALAAMPRIATRALRQWEHMQARHRAEGEIRRLNRELEHRVLERTAELEHALRELKLLSGLLPICSMCKKIRDTDDAWVEVERYVSDRTDAEFSHGYCPDCAERSLEELSRDLRRHRAEPT
ncbi:MAG: response regulator [Verrucomicrobia bacterium]|nr:response regulator [Verrucomicrobiota bacterium]MDA1088184.1 response regulator [Verrucomicrobiota bacterium]